MTNANTDSKFFTGEVVLYHNGNWNIAGVTYYERTPYYMIFNPDTGDIRADIHWQHLGRIEQ